MNISDSDNSVCASVLHRRLKLAEGHDGECISKIYKQHHFISNHLKHIIQDKVSTGESANSWNNVPDIHSSVMEGRDLFEGTESAILLEEVDNDDVPTCGNEQCNCQGQSELVEAQGNGNGKCDSENSSAAGECNGENETVADADESGNINPILIPSVINHVVSFLSCTDLKQCRIINKQWNEECCKFLRKRGLVKLTSQSKIVRFTAQFNNNKRFCENFYFEIAKAMDEETNKLLDIFGSFIKSVKLDFSSTSYHMTAEDFFNLIFIKLPNLEELSLVGAIGENDHFLPKDKRIENSSTSIKNSNVSSSKSANQTETTLPKLKNLEIFLYNSTGKNVSKHVFLIELLRCVPKLEKISVPKVPRMLSFGMPLLHTLITSEQISFNNLQHLDMDIALYNGSIDILKSKKYPLKYLNAEINSTVSEDSLHSLLETYGKTLVSLQLKFPISPVASSEFRSAASFQVLKHLTLHGYQGSLKFLEQLNLHTFGLIDNSFSLAVQRENFDRPLKARFHYQMIWTDWTEEAYFFDCLNSSDTQLLRVFSNNFLNLSSLNLPHLNESDLRIIYVTFSHSLQELCMENSLCDDFGLTGINHAIVHNLNSVENIEDVRTRPFIGNLKRLRRLEILSPSIHMTDASIIYGIVYCENLKVCIIRNASISNVGLEKLVDLMYLEHLETTSCANIEGPAVKYALEKMTSQGATYVWNKYQGRLTSCCINRFLNSNAAVTCEVP